MAFMTKVLSDVQSCGPQRRRGWKDRPVCNIIVSQRGSLLLFLGQCIPDKWLMQDPFGKTALQCSWSSVAWIKFGTSCVVVVKIKILKSIGKFEQTEIMCCITLHLSTMWAAPVWSQSKPTQRKSHWKFYNALLLCGTCWENMPRDTTAAHAAPPAASEIELMYCTWSSENIHGFHQI